MARPTNVPFYIRHLPALLLLLCAAHLSAKSTMLKHQYAHVLENTTNTHFGVTCVIVFLLCLLTSLCIVDMLYKTHFTFRYVIGMNIAVVGSLMFVAGYLFGHLAEIGIARLSNNPCRQLGINALTNTTSLDDNSLHSSLDVAENEHEHCRTAIALEYMDIVVDLLLISFFTPLHISATAFSWTFSGLYRPRCHAVK